MSHGKKRSHPRPHESVCGAVTEAESAMVGDFLRDTGRLGLGRDRERGRRAAPATQAQRWPAPGTGPVLVGRRVLGMEDEELPSKEPPGTGLRLEITILTGSA